LRSAKTGFRVGKNRFSGREKNRFAGRQKPVFRSLKPGFKIGKNPLSGRQKPVLRSAKSGFEIGENRFSGIVYEVEDSSIKYKTRREKEPELSLSSASLSKTGFTEMEKLV